MRKLNKKQTKILTQEFIKNHPKSVMDINPGILNDVYALNPHEDFEGNVDRFLTDLQQSGAES
jgi:hypothetical protein